MVKVAVGYGYHIMYIDICIYHTHLPHAPEVRWKARVKQWMRKQGGTLGSMAVQLRALQAGTSDNAVPSGHHEQQYGAASLSSACRVEAPRVRSRSLLAGGRRWRSMALQHRRRRFGASSDVPARPFPAFTGTSA